MTKMLRKEDDRPEGCGARHQHEEPGHDLRRAEELPVAAGLVHRLEEGADRTLDRNLGEAMAHELHPAGRDERHGEQAARREDHPVEDGICPGPGVQSVEKGDHRGTGRYNVRPRSFLHR